MLGLAIDTTTLYVNFSLLEKGQTLLNLQCYLPQTEQLVQCLKAGFSLSGRNWQDLTCVGVVTGPGGYTSTRSGIMAAKTITMLNNIPLIGINKIEALIYQYREKNELICPILTIRKNQIYTAIGSFFKDDLTYVQEPHLDALENWQERLTTFNQPIMIVQDAIDPEALARLTALYYQNGTRTAFYEVNPFYVRGGNW